MKPLLKQLLTLPGRGLKTFTLFQQLDETLHHPHRSFKTVHVGGTNGKGSVSLKVAQALQEEGHTVGLYTSPHLWDVRERIRINGVMIEESELEALLTELFAFSSLSFFDYLTMAAFLHFQRRKVDWAVIEVGLGGRLDPTNVILPQIAAIVSIGMDHTALLGDSLEKIAREKGGIAKPGIPLVVGPSAAPFFPKAIATRSAPFYDLENNNVARRVLEHLGISEKAILRGLVARPSCRFEVRGSHIFDVAHNPEGFRKLKEALQFHFPGETFHFVVAFSQDKDWALCLDCIRPIASRISALRCEHPKLVAPNLLGLERVLDAIPGATRSEKVVVCGSFYLYTPEMC